MQKVVKFNPVDQKKFFATLRQRVNGHFSENNISKNGDIRMFIKSMCMLGIYFVPFAFIISGIAPYWLVPILYAVMGFGLAGIGMSVMHDANHGAYSKKPFINKLFGASVDIVGGNAFTWKMQHNVLHHTYTNIYNLDEDIHDKPILRLSPYGKFNKVHRFQHIYASILYCFATLSWVILKDFKQIINYRELGLIKKAKTTFAKELTKMILFKIFYFSYILVLPIVLLSVPVGSIILGFLLMHFVAGFILTIIFQLAHVVEGPSHHDLVEDNQALENTWAIHQLETTADFARNNRLITWYVGGLNFQIEHHLFPNICHVHYKSIAKIVQNTAKEFNLPYYYHTSVTKAMISHFKVLKAFGNNRRLATS